MAIETINTGSSPNDDTGDSLRTWATKVNGNFTDSENAASRLVTESATDTTAGRLLKVGDGGRITAGLRKSGTFNLDTIIDEGLYFISPATDTVSGTLPFGVSPFILEVVPASVSDSDTANVNRRVIQRAYRYDSSNTESYRASNALGFFYPWQEILHTGNMVGTVSQSGGVPTGAVIERGSNANGEYTKFADGTLICTKSHVFGLVSSTGHYPANDLSFPVAYIGAPRVTGSVHFNYRDASIDFSIHFSAIREQYFDVTVSLSSTPPVERALLANVIAIGYWY